MENGYGEYLIIDRSKDGGAISKEDHDAAFDLIESIIRNGEVHENRTALVREKVQELNQSLDVVFIPRTLYELIYIQVAICEESDANTPCKMQNKRVYRRQFINGNNEDFKNENFKSCWHLCRFLDSEEYIEEYVGEYGEDNWEEYLKQ